MAKAKAAPKNDEPKEESTPQQYAIVPGSKGKKQPLPKGWL